MSKLSPLRRLQLDVQLKEQETNLARNKLRIAELDVERQKLVEGIDALQSAVEQTQEELNG